MLAACFAAYAGVGHDSVVAMVCPYGLGCAEFVSDVVIFLALDETTDMLVYVA